MGRKDDLLDLTGIDPTIGAAIVNMGSALSSLILKGTATAVQGKIESLKNEKNVDTIRNSYNEMINQILSEREEALLIAQSYKQELDKVVISDEDITYLQETVSKVLDLIKALQLIDIMSGDPEKQKKAQETMDSLEAIKNLISKEVLKTMQLLGFNYKAAIGEPLTELCANAIRNLGNGKRNTTNGGNRKNNR